MIFLAGSWPTLRAQECEEGVLTDTSGLSATQIHGGQSGAFVREMTCPRYTGIASYLTPPDYQTSDLNEQPWIYYGFSDGYADAEAGLSFQGGDGDALLPRWRPYLNVNGTYLYASESFSVSPDTRIWLKAAYSDGLLSLWLNSDRILEAAVTLDPEQTRVRRVTAIATPYAFDGRNIDSPGLKEVFWESTLLSRDGGTSYLPFDSEPLSAWREGGIWYGSVYWPSDHISYDEKGESDTISIFADDEGSGCRAGRPDRSSAFRWTCFLWLPPLIRQKRRHRRRAASALGGPSSDA